MKNRRLHLRCKNRRSTYKNGKILVQRDKNGNEYALPGDHVKPGETTVDRLGLEFREETGSDILCERLLWTEECLYELNGKSCTALLITIS